MNEDYYVYKNYNSGIYIGEMTEHGCVVGYDALTNKYVAMLDDGTGQVSNVYSKEEVNNLINSVNTNVTNNTNEITSIKESITSLQTDISNYALKTELDGLSSVVSGNIETLQTKIDNISGVKIDYCGGTTNATGNLETPIGSSTNVIGARIISGVSDGYVIPYFSYTTGTWWMRIKRWDDTTLSNTAVELYIYYFK